MDIKKYLGQLATEHLIGLFKRTFVKKTDYDTETQTINDKITAHTSSKANPHGVTVSQIGAVPTTRKINNKSLSGDIALSASDVGALPNTTVIPTKTSQLTNDSGFKTTDNNTTYSLSKSGSTITLTGSDGSTTSVTDSNTTYSLGSFGITASSDELNKLDGVTASTAEINKLKGLTPTTTELNYVDGVTSGIQGQLDSKASSGALADALEEAKNYTDEQIAELIDGAPTTLDTLGEIATAMNENADVVEALDAAIGSKASKTELSSHTSNKSNPHGVTAAQVGAVPTSRTVNGKALSANITLTASDVNALPNTTVVPTKTSQLTNDSGFKTTDNNTTYTINKDGSTITLVGSDGSTTSVEDSNTTYPVASTSANGLMSSSDKTKLNNIAAGAEVNQNAFSNIVVGSTTIAADGKQDTLTMVAGTGIGLTPDATNDKVTINNAGVRSITTGSANGTISVNTNGTSADVAVKGLGSAAYTASTAYAPASHNHTIANIDSLQSTLDGKAGKSTATTSANGLMSSGDKTKLDNIEAGANKTTVDTALSGTSTNPVQNKVIKSALDGKQPSGSYVTTNDTGVQSIAGGLVLGGSSATATAKGRLMITGHTNPLIGLQAIDANGEQLTPYYFQVSNDKMYLGPTSAKALSFDRDGNASIPANLNVGGVITGNAATQSVAGLMSADDKKKLDGVATGANAYTLPTANSSTLGGVKTTSTVTSTSGLTACPIISGVPYYKDTTYTSLKNPNTLIFSGSIIREIYDGSEQVKIPLAGKDVSSEVYTIDGTTVNGGYAAEVFNDSYNIATGGFAHAEGQGTIAAGHFSHVQGVYNIKDTTSTYAHIVGNGYDNDTRSNAHTLDWFGNAWFAGDVLFGGTGQDTATRSVLEGLNKIDNTNIAYGTCVSAPDTAAKVITISGNPNWTLATGSIIVVKFTNTNSAQNPTFNVNGTGAKSIWYNTALITTSSLSYAGYQNRYGEYMYDGTQFVFLGWSYDSNSTYSNASLGQGYGTCSTAAATVAKTVTLSSYSLTKGGIVAVKFTYAVPAGATLNINSKGAKAIFYKGKAIVDGVICAGEIGTFIYDGTQYHLIAVDRNRFYTSLVPYGTSIAANSDLNTTQFLKVGNYYCSKNADVETLTNCPTEKAFMLQVLSPLSSAVDNETTGTWVYRVRKLQDYTGPEYVQYCYSDGTAGHWIYGDWKKVITTVGGTAVGSATQPIYLSSSGTPTKCTYTLEKSVPSNAVFTDTTYSASNGISLSGTTFSNAGVRSITTGSANGTISVNTNGTSADVAVKGLGSAAYTESTAYAPASHNQSAATITSGTLAIARGGTGVTSHTDTTYTTARYRASALVSSATNPTVNGVINWQYE